MILTAGEGTRMRPLTLTRPKTMLPISGKPILQYNIESIRDAGIDEIFLVVGYKKNVIKKYFADGKEFGVKLSYLIQEKQLGTAHAIGKGKNVIDEEFIVVNGDVITDPNLIKEVINYYERNTPDTLLLLTKVKDPSSFGIVELEDDKVKNIIEKPKPEEAPSDLANAGIYIFNPIIFNYIEKTQKSPRGEYEITDSIMMEIKDGIDVRGFVSKKRWIDIGRPWELLNANEEMMKNIKTKIEGEVEENVHIKGPVVIGRGTIVRSGTYIQGPVYIGKNCDIGPNCYIRAYTCIYDGVSIGNAVEIKNSIIMENTNINHLSYVGDSIIGANCNFGAGTNIANLKFNDKPVKMNVKGERVSTSRRKLGAVFGDNVKTGINSGFNPGVKIGMDSVIWPNALIDEDVDSNKAVIVQQEKQIVDNFLKSDSSWSKKEK